jgi:hypothetical protein
MKNYYQAMSIKQAPRFTQQSSNQSEQYFALITIYPSGIRVTFILSSAKHTKTYPHHKLTHSANFLCKNISYCSSSSSSLRKTNFFIKKNQKVDF